MLPIELLNQQEKKEFTNYSEAINYLASNTLVYFNGIAINSKANKPTYDISQVCCWISGQPLRNGMHLCALESRRIALVEEPKEEEFEGAEDGKGMNVEVESTRLDVNNLILISTDCYEGLKKSLEYFQEQPEQQLIQNPNDPNQGATPWNYKNYIWPIKRYNNKGEEDKEGGITSEHCFIYTKKTALVQYLEAKKEENEEGDSKENKNVPPPEISSETFKEFLFVEANPTLPDPLYVMAQNTIRLFRLNSCYYEHLKNKEYHYISYNASNMEHEYDGLRLEGRMQAYKRARKSLQQLKTVRALLSTPETIEILISQYQILLELTGYPSVWATVFKEGGDPGGFTAIMGGVPVPTGPVTTGPIGIGTVTTGPPKAISIRRKRKADILPLDSAEKLDPAEKLINSFKEFISKKEGWYIDNNKLEENKKTISESLPAKNSSKKRRIDKLSKELIDSLFTSVVNNKNDNSTQNGSELNELKEEFSDSIIFAY